MTGSHELLNKFGISFTKMLNSVGLRLQPCLTPIYDLKKGVIPLFNLTDEFTEQYILKETMSTTMHLFTFYLESDGMSTNNDYKHFFGALSLQFC